MRTEFPHQRMYSGRITNSLPRLLLSWYTSESMGREWTEAWAPSSEWYNLGWYEKGAPPTVKRRSCLCTSMRCTISGKEPLNAPTRLVSSWENTYSLFDQTCWTLMKLGPPTRRSSSIVCDKVSDQKFALCCTVTRLYPKTDLHFLRLWRTQSLQYI